MAPSATSIPHRVAAEYHRLGVHGRVVLAVSGGADSMALLRATLVIAESAGLSPTVAHFDHGLRPESAADAEWLAAQASALGVEFVTERPDESVSTASAEGIEETARKRRYRFLVRAAEMNDAAFVVTAHTADDQTETVLFQMLRGSGLRGLRGIPPTRRLSDSVTVARPLLGVSRAEIESYLKSIGQPWRNDPTNADAAFTRNRLRHDLLPRLRQGVNPRLDEALRKLSRQAGEATEFLERSARRELKVVAIELSPSLIRLDSDRLRRRPRAVIRETIALAWRRGRWPRKAMGFAHWDALADLTLVGGRRSLPGGVDARRRRKELILDRGER